MIDIIEIRDLEEKQRQIEEMLIDECTWRKPYMSHRTEEVHREASE